MPTKLEDKPPVNNGVNVEALFGAQAALKDAPEAAKFKWRSTVERLKQRFPKAGL